MIKVNDFVDLKQEIQKYMIDVRSISKVHKGYINSRAVGEIYNGLLESGNSIIEGGSDNVEYDANIVNISVNGSYLSDEFVPLFKYDELAEEISKLEKLSIELNEFELTDLNNLTSYISGNESDFEDSGLEMISKVSANIGSVQRELSGFVVYAKNLLKEIPDNYLQEVLGQLAIVDFDEVMSGSQVSGNDNNFTQSELYFRDAMDELIYESFHGGDNPAPYVLNTYGSKPIENGHELLIQRVSALRSKADDNPDLAELKEAYSLLSHIGTDSMHLTHLGKNAIRFLRVKMKADK